ncbi:MAG: DUF86 domain-containing protein [Alphaproteobacteria bacterium]|nr:DUF86 domain-containing protein [Alphaproteobacteria bacterium]
MGGDAGKYLWDAKVAADRIARFTAGKSFNDYRSDEMMRSAVERQFEIIGEALSALRRVAPEMIAAIPEATRIIAFRNVLIHQYAAVDDLLVWGVVEGKLPDLRSALGRLLGDVGTP